MPNREVNWSQIAGREPVARDDADLVLPVGRLLRLVQQVAADLADVDERRRAVADHLVPEPRRRERLAQGKRCAGIQHRRHRDRQRVVVVERQTAIQGVVAVQPHADAAEPGQRPQPAVVRHDAGLGHPGGARREDVERLVLGQHRRGDRGIVGGRVGGQPLELVDGDRVGDLGAGLFDRFQQLVLTDQHPGIEQIHAVGQHLAPLVVVQHARDRAELDHRKHQQHRARRVLQHDPDDVAPPDAPRGQHRRVGLTVSFACR